MELLIPPGVRGASWDGMAVDDNLMRELYWFTKGQYKYRYTWGRGLVYPYGIVGWT